MGTRGEPAFRAAWSQRERRWDLAPRGRRNRGTRGSGRARQAGRIGNRGSGPESVARVDLHPPRRRRAV